MLRVALRNLFSRKARLFLTAFAVVLGVAFVSGTFVLTDTLKSVFNGLFANVNRGVDVVVEGREAFSQTPGPGTNSTREPVPDALLSVVRGVPGVRAVEGGIGGYALVVRLRDGKPAEAIQPTGPPTIGVAWGTDRELNSWVGGDGRPEVGRRPRAPTEVALDQVTAGKAGIANAAVQRCAATGRCRGAQVQVVFLRTPPQIFDVVAVFQFGTVGNLAGATLAAFDPPTAQVVLNRVHAFDTIRVAADSGTSSVDLRDAVRAAIRRDAPGSAVDVLTGAQFAKQQADDINQGLSFFNTFLLVFALIALFVGAFIIYNIFSITVAQRAREIGLLRALGASGTQVRGSVTIEALVVGVIASATGLLAGIGLAVGLELVMRAFNIRLPSGGLVVQSRTVVVSLVAGTLVTFVSAVAPARRASLVPPMTALRSDARTPSSGRRRYVVGGLLAAIGAVALALGLFGNVEGVPGGAAGLVGVASALVFVGVAMLSPLVSRPVVGLLGAVPARMRGMSGVLARENAARNPRRTASTASALMIGLALITVVSVFGASLKRTLRDTIASNFRAEFVLNASGFNPIAPAAADAARQGLPGADVTEFRFGQFELRGKTQALLGVDENVARSIDIGPVGDALGRFRRTGGLIVYAKAAATDGIHVGDVLTLRFAATGERQVRVVGLYASTSAKLALGNDYLLAMHDFERNYTDQLDAFVTVRSPSGVALGAAQRSLKHALAQFPNIRVQNQAEFQQTQEDSVGQLLNLMTILLLLSVVIALFGIGVAMALSVFERTHELGLLRAVGMLRAQMRRMVRDESVMVAVFGALLGVALGLVFGAAMVQALADQGLQFAVPVGQLAIYVVVAGLFGLAAGWWPARRAARLDVLRAIATE